MTARQVLWRLPRREHVLPTHRAIVLVLVLETTVRVVDIDGDAHAAFLTMAEGLATSDAAKATLFAMKGLFRLRHPEVACATMVLGELDTATRAPISVG